MADEALQSIAHNVRRLRDERGMSQVDLAKRAGLSRQMVALIEGAESNPSVATLAEVAKSLGVTLAQLVDSPSSVHPRLIPPTEFKPLWRGKKGSEGRLVVASSSGKSTELWLWNIAAGATYEAAGEVAEEFLLLLDGELELKFADEVCAVPPKHAVCLPLQQPYKLTAHGRTGARFVLLFVPN
jgi:transcriptional regulator with XRE-family HTH domain